MSISEKAFLRPERDYRVDFFRGIALVMIFVNHIPGIMWEHFTSRNFGFSDSAEGFVFLAGLASAFAYGRLYLEGSPLVASLKAARRSGVLYLVHIALTMSVISLFIWFAMARGNGEILRQIGLGTLLTQPLDALYGVATLGNQLGYLNILPLYSALLLLLPVMLFCIRLIGLKGFLAASVAVWLAAGMLRLNIPNYPNAGGWFFNPFSWQLIFAMGLYCGFEKLRGRAAVAYSPKLYAVAVAWLLFSWAFIAFRWWYLERMIPLPSLFVGFDKTFASVPRLLHLAALVYVLAYAPSFTAISRVGRDNPLTMLGRHSLPVFAVGTFLSLWAQALRFGHDTTIAYDTILVAAGLSIQFGLARYLDWWGQVSKPAPRRVASTKPAKAEAADAAQPLPKVL
ncbi:OpgC domain-containing protein [Aureimonas fodinaquatilis]|uniref:OpgC domain-containing protein n=1 Tax=Aureimonas fodinaquatilis TaxID=2565783 RepID=A0A5B0E0T8_9HYPH|nr:OpgC domain-containing protein [Aureimonas fodinaquatilis]KAA0971735.1 OpgC domain-containing protein [Aureimonas fodinaquatilis]